MNTFKTLLLLPIIWLSTFIPAHADEGMWLPLLIKRLNYEEMQKKGCKLSPEEIYSVNQACLKDAVVWFGGFCSGEIVSGQGLILTNHHCGFSAIQSHSSVEHDYISNGFWAKELSDELPNMGLTASILVRMEDVSSRINAELKEDMSLEQRNAKIADLSTQIQKEAIEGTHYEASVKSFFNGNEFYLFVYEVFKDVRLVGAPPESIGSFGGDTDNWMWPRHSGDFSLFRIYANADNKPAEYNKDNIPFKPRHFLPVSLKGVQPNDFTMVMGFPGRTDRYALSEGVKQTVEIINPARIKLREKRLALIKEDMDATPSVRIQYASKYARVSNYYKYFIGQNKGVKRLNVVESKKTQETAFTSWVASGGEERKNKYGNLLPEINKAYSELAKYRLSNVYLSEGAFGIEILALASKYIRLQALLKDTEKNKEQIKATCEGFKKELPDFFKNYNASTDKKVMAALLQYFAQDVPKEQQADIFNFINSKYKNNFTLFAEKTFATSLFADRTKLEAFLSAPTLKALEADLAFKTIASIKTNYDTNIQPKILPQEALVEKYKRYYTTGVREMQSSKIWYPDANSTIRLSYGQVQPYDPADAVKYHHLTTLDGLIEKEDPKNSEFIVPERLKTLYKAKDYGKYASADGKLPVCFISNNDITGGNSGSPVINGQGHLIGIAFDGNWEAMSGDIVFDEKYKRTISVDIRYVLFVIDKYAGATRLIQEMKLVE